MESLEQKNTAASPEHTKEFSSMVEIDGLPFVFKGKIDEDKKDIYLSVLLPTENEDIKRVSNKAGMPHSLMAYGEVGYIAAGVAEGKESELYISRVRSHAGWLPPDSKYRNAHIGRFLMDNLLALADMRGWKMSAFAYTDGRLSNEDVNAWLERKGFSPSAESSELVRQPQESDSKQPIVRLLGSVSHTDQKDEQ